MKSPLAEWAIDVDNRSCWPPRFEMKPCVRETVHMYADCGDAVFWNKDGLCVGSPMS